MYLASGVGGNLLSLAFGNDNSLGAGASTALFGIMGAMAMVGFKNKESDLLSFLGRQALALAVINLLLDIFMPDVDILGHLGGLISGLLLAALLGDETYKQFGFWSRMLATVLLAVYVVVTVRLGMVINL